MWRPAILLLASAWASAVAGGCASLPEEEANLRFAAMAPLRDLNIGQPPVPGQLNALYQPYGYIDQTGCRAWSREIGELEAALLQNEGRIIGFRRDNETFEGRVGNARDSGVAALARSPIPFRGVVRQLSGAAQFEQRAFRASDRARYRIGYLVGLARSHRCPGFGTLQPAPPNAATPLPAPAQPYRPPYAYGAPVTTVRPPPQATGPTGAAVRRGAARRR
ncbi:MAG: hypothetical protein AAF311_00450 [Pseudomonadota bacterium]